MTKDNGQKHCHKVNIDRSVIRATEHVELYFHLGALYFKLGLLVSFRSGRNS